MKNKPLSLLISENVTYAKVLNRFGLDLTESGSKTLEEICEENGFDVENLTHILEKSKSRRAPEYLDLKNYPIRLIVEYLKHAHQVFVKDSLPYLLRKIDEIDANHPQEMIEDLKVVIPMFVEDFIHHIYEEEDHFFKYVCELEKYVSTGKSSGELIKNFERFSIQEFALHHNGSDHEMKGIRDITDHYNVKNVSDADLKVLLQSLEQFDHDLTVHANIENDILFPKALSLEKQAKVAVGKKSELN